ncbi:copper/silver efflux system outer membrane protein CusC [Kluyvera intermedia]|nr:copper/silver efflux system outer membrane protein CusC [Kluyvera intermedia]
MFNAKQLMLMMAFILAGCTSLAPDYQPPEKRGAGAVFALARGIGTDRW